MEAFVTALMALYQHFKLASKSLTDREGPLPETLLSATIKAANKTILVASKQPKNRHGLTIFTIIWLRQTR